MSQPSCGVCGEGVETEAGRACATCAAPHHLDCWEFTGGCSIYGCGESRSLALSELPVERLTGELTVTEGSAPSVLAPSRGLSLYRRFRSRAVDLPGTLAWGIGGTAAGCVALSMVVGKAPQGKEVAALIGAGFVHGLVAPFLAPLQHRRPGAVGLASLASFVGFFAFLEHNNSWMPFGVPLVGAWLLSWMLAASSLADWILGPRSAVGLRLGRLATPLRLLATWVLAAGIFLLAGSLISADLAAGRTNSLVAVLSFSVTLVASSALEKGKREYRRSLPPSRR